MCLELLKNPKNLVFHIIVIFYHYHAIGVLFMLGLDYNTRLENEMLDLPFSFYYVDATHLCYQAPLHWHRAFELVRIVKGSLTIFLDKNEYTYQEGEIVIINRRVIHGFSPTDCVYEIVNFDLEKLLSKIHLAGDSISFFVSNHFKITPKTPELDSPLYKSCLHLFEVAKQNCGELIILGSLLELMGIIYAKHYYTEIKTNTSSYKSVELLKPIMDFIEKSFMQNITLKQMADAGAISVSYMSFLFRDILTQTPMDYLNSYRIERACMLLISSEKLITEVAYNCGFNDSGYFVKVFKKYKGVTPKKYRDMLK